MVKEESMFKSGQLPKFRDNLYHDAEDDRWMVPTSEVTLTTCTRMNSWRKPACRYAIRHTLPASAKNA